MLKCAFDRGEGMCSALTEKSCEGCRFFKTEMQVAVGRERAKKRIQSLPEITKKHIYDTYYPKSRRAMSKFKEG